MVLLLRWGCVDDGFGRFYFHCLVRVLRTQDRAFSSFLLLLLVVSIIYFIIVEVLVCKRVPAPPPQVVDLYFAGSLATEISFFSPRWGEFCS